MFKVIGFDKKEHNFNFTKNNSRKYQNNKSSLHLKARTLLNELFPHISIYEEVTLPGSKRIGRPSLLYADFFIPELMCIIEVHGKQHYEYSSFFHANKLDFVYAKRRDTDKIEWGDMNGIKVIVLPYNEEKRWKHLIQQSVNQ